MRVRALATFVIGLALSCVSSKAQTAGAGPSASELFGKGMNALVGSSATRGGANAIEYFHRSADMGYARRKSCWDISTKPGARRRPILVKRLTGTRKRRSRTILWRSGWRAGLFMPG